LRNGEGQFDRPCSDAAALFPRKEPEKKRPSGRHFRGRPRSSGRGCWPAPWQVPMPVDDRCPGQRRNRGGRCGSRPRPGCHFVRARVQAVSVFSARRPSVVFGLRGQRPNSFPKPGRRLVFSRQKVRDDGPPSPSRALSGPPFGCAPCSTRFRPRGRKMIITLLTAGISDSILEFPEVLQ